MTHARAVRRSTGRLLIAAGICWVISGCATGAARAPGDPANSRAEALKKLSPAEIMATADQAARRGEYDRAIGLYMQAIEAEPSADLWYRVGWVYLTLGKKQLAAQAFSATIELDPGNARAHEELGLFLVDNKQRELGAAHLRRAIELDPGQWRSHNALGVLADAAQDHAAAIAHYEAALAVVPASAQLLNNLGYSYYLAGDLDKAAAIYPQALAAEPGHRAATANLGLLHARRGQYARALEVMGAVMNPAKAHNDVGYVAFQNGDLEQAESLLREAISLSPSYYETAHQNLSRVRRARNARRSAIADPASTEARAVHP